MARTDNLTNFLTDIASSIKTKKGYDDSTKIDAANFDTEIDSIEGTGEVLTGTTSPVSSEGKQGDVYVYYSTENKFLAPLYFLLNQSFESTSILRNARYNLAATSIVEDGETATITLTLTITMGNNRIGASSSQLIATCQGQTKTIMESNTAWPSGSVQTFTFEFNDVDIKNTPTLTGGIKIVKTEVLTNRSASVLPSVVNNIKSVYQKTNDTDWSIIIYDGRQW